MIREAIKKLSDEKIDQTIKSWGTEVLTFLYDFEASMALGKDFEVLVTPDKKYMHIKKPKTARDRARFQVVQDGTNLISVED